MFTSGPEGNSTTIRAINSNFLFKQLMAFRQLAAQSFHQQWETTHDSVLHFNFTEVSKPRHAKLDSKVSAWAQEGKQPGIQRHSITRAHEGPAALETTSVLHMCLRGGMGTFC